MTHTPVFIDLTKPTLANFPHTHVLRENNGAIVALCPLADTPLRDGQFSYAPAIQHAVNSLPALVKALEAEEEADRLFDAADEYTHRADAEDWLNDPTGSLHVNEAWGRANAKRAEAKELRRSALASHKTGG